jgi:hypothetical protein
VEIGRQSPVHDFAARRRCETGKTTCLVLDVDLASLALLAAEDGRASCGHGVFLHPESNTGGAFGSPSTSQEQSRSLEAMEGLSPVTCLQARLILSFITKHTYKVLETIKALVAPMPATTDLTSLMMWLEPFLASLHPHLKATLGPRVSGSKLHTSFRCSS